MGKLIKLPEPPKDVQMFACEDCGCELFAIPIDPDGKVRTFCCAYDKCMAGYAIIFDKDE